MNSVYYNPIWWFGMISGYLFYALPFTGILILLFPAKSLKILEKFPLAFHIYVAIILMVEFMATFGFVWGVGMKYTGNGIMGMLTDNLAIPIILILFFAVYLFSILRYSKLQSKGMMAFYTAMVLATPLYLVFIQVVSRIVAG